jgi:molybdenum cofactor cytidylyltransferase
MLNNWAVILAAGSSRRMGQQKLLMPFGSSTIIETVVQNVVQSNLKHILVVLGANSEAIKSTLNHLPVNFCHNENHHLGMLSSVICGFRNVPEDAGAVLVYLGDQPGIPPVITNRIIDAYNEDLKGIVIPVHDNRRGHPLLVDMKYQREIEKLDLEQGLRSLMHQFPQDVLEVDVDEPGILVDIDTREDYSKATKTK